MRFQNVRGNRPWTPSPPPAKLAILPAQMHLASVRRSRIHLLGIYVLFSLARHVLGNAHVRSDARSWALVWLPLLLPKHSSTQEQKKI